MRSLSFISCFLFSLLALSQNDTIKKSFYFENGKVSSEGLMYQDKPVGYWKAYYPSGILKSEGNREGYLLEGTWLFYNEHGDLKKEITYKAGKKTGISNIYNDSCYLVRAEHYFEDKMDGKVREYYENDTTLKAIIPYSMGLKDGTGFEYAQDDERIITITEYNHGFVKKREKINRKNALGKQGTWREFYNEGTLHKEMRYKNDVLHGYYKEYDRDGKLIVALLYLDGIVQENPEELSTLDIRREYYASGQIRVEGTYNYLGEKEGSFKYFKENGDVEQVQVYSKDQLLAKGKVNKEGERIELWEFFYPDSSLRAKGEYKKGLRIGTWVFYHNNGKLEQKGKYVKGEKPHGEWVWYYSNGDVWREENFWKGKEDGMAIEYSDTGTVISQGQYVDGKKDGEWFYEMGDHREAGIYIEGYKEGEWVHYYTNKKVKFKGSYKAGDPDGKHQYYFPNGRMKREEYYELGFEEGTWRTYNEEGELMLTSEWKGGKEVKLDRKKVK